MHAIMLDSRGLVRRIASASIRRGLSSYPSDNTECCSPLRISVADHAITLHVCVLWQPSRRGLSLVDTV